MHTNETGLMLRFIEYLSDARFVPIGRGRQVAKGRGRELFKSFSSDNHIFQATFQVRGETAPGQFWISNMRRFLNIRKSSEYFFRRVDGDSIPRAGL
jgi:hypothetical protein